MLSLSEITIADALRNARGRQDKLDQRLEEYFNLSARIKQFGLAVPEGMEIFEVPLSWPLVAVDGIMNRSQVKALLKTDPTGDTQDLEELYNANQLESQTVLFNQDKAVFGRAFWSVGATTDSEYPLITPEPPRELSVHIDKRRRRIDAALRVFTVDATDPFTQGMDDGEHAILYTPTKTVHIARAGLGGKWREVARDDHNLGAVPIIMSLNRQMTGKWGGKSVMEPVIPLTDMAVRTLTNTQFGAETTTAPRKYAVGVQEADFRDAKTGALLNRWEAYMNAVWLLKNKDAKVGQLDGADLTQFIQLIEMLGKLASVATGMPASKFGITTANPQTEGAVVHDEIDQIRAVDRFNSESGLALGWAIDLGRRFMTGHWADLRDRTVVQWHNPATPTESQRSDAIVKLTGGKPVLSIEGAWDEMGWSEPRKEQERQRLLDEQMNKVFLNTSESIEDGYGAEDPTSD